MTLAYRLATISYCPDLTDPHALSIPIAVLAVGKDQGKWSAAAVGLEASKLGLDPLASAMLADVPHMIRRHVDAVMRRLEDRAATPGAVLRELHDSLKTSIHVSNIGEERSLQEPDARRVPTRLFEELIPALGEALRAASARAAATPAQKWRPEVTPEALMDPAPDQAFWKPSLPAGHTASA